MVKEVKAWAAEDGSIHATQLDAAKHDARLQLQGPDKFKHETINAMIDNAELVVAALRPLAETTPL